ncbi:MAG: hypothetical protein JSR28_14030 [Proteobacteria bacterium]|nr:hypothetical protein [Pseudomonadota bacterium]
MSKAKQKIYTSIEVDPSFAKTAWERSGGQIAFLQSVSVRAMWGRIFGASENSDLCSLFCPLVNTASIGRYRTQQDKKAPQVNDLAGLFVR